MAATRRTPPGRALLRHDRALDAELVVGADEAGRGALAGPLVAAAVLLEPRSLSRDEVRALARLDDSKRVAPAVRDELAATIARVARRIAVVAIASDEIDRAGIQAANLGGLSRAIDRLAPPEGAIVLVDGFALPRQARPHRALVRGDGTSAAVAAAAIIAKTTRDRLMRHLGEVAPGYGFAEHAGYGTAAHREALARLGPAPAHRRSFGSLADAA